jgi:hypothetical protein
MPNPTQSTADGAVQSKGGQAASQQASTDQAGAPPEGQTGRTFTKAEFDTMQSKKDKEIRDLRASLRAAETRTTDLEDSNESLKGKFESLQSEVDQGIPDDVKEYKTQLQKREEALKKAERDFKKDRSQWDTDLAERDENERKSLAQTLADKYGVDASMLLGFDSPEKMKAYALDNMDPTKLSPGTSESTTTSTKTEPKPTVISPGNEGGATKTLREKTPDERITEGLAKLKSK